MSETFFLGSLTKKWKYSFYLLLFLCCKLMSLLTARPWAERGSWFTRGFFFRLLCEQTQASTRPNFESRNLWCLLAKSCWNINKSHLSQEKIKKPSTRQKLYFFTRNLARNIYIFIFVWIVNEMTFSGYFFLRGQPKPPITKSRRTYTLQKNLFKTLTSKRYNTSALIATTHWQKVNLFLNNPALSC